MRSGDVVALLVVLAVLALLGLHCWQELKAARRRRDCEQLGIGGRGVRR